MTALIALVRKDLILYINDKRALMLHLLMPVILAAFFGSLFGGGSEAKTSKIDVGLVQLDQSDSGKKIAAGLKADSALNIVELSADDAKARVRAGKLPVAVVIPDGFGEQASDALFGGKNKPQLPVYYDPSQSTVLAMVKGLLTQQVMQVTSAAVMSPKGSKTIEKQLDALSASTANNPDNAQLGDFLTSLKKFQDQRAAAEAEKEAAAKASGKPAPAAEPVGMTMPYTTQDQALSSGPKYNGYAHSFAGMGVQFILFMGIDMGVGILLARRTGVWNRLLAAPVSLTTVLWGRAISGALIAMGLMCAMFACAMLIFKVEIGSLGGFLGIAASFSLMTAAFGLLIAAFGKTPEAARGIAVFATLIMVMLGGAWVPSFVFPEWVQQATLLVPTRWAIDGFDAVTWRGLGLEGALMPIAVQLGFAAVFGGIADWKFLSDHK
ncbi:ABC transporter permease [Duganella sp. BJB488]|uniref:ABC transporter permease n=1 Tax=unclassified Duganella TaxID=2636909 RepID=UPI000E34C46F|nr:MULTISPECIES: ABC transporter permease [unclassified Duganella]RFP22751.1 ABC transporter permease [Duganella sp. BJB489]RFP25174.1 ABC transporter permease [Duganella sp. BJB488]RFP33750.1 ABC transporter permease [Duganella sp. BJB480]